MLEESLPEKDLGKVSGGITVDGIAGESIHKKHNDWIGIE